MLASQAEVVGLHPMRGSPKSPTLKGRMMVVCEARLRHWSEWVQTLCAALQAECVYATPEHHDRVMALVQAMVHATHLVQAGTLRDYAPLLGELRALMPYRSASFELDNAVIARILSLNPSIYEDIQFGNPYVGEMLDQMLLQLQQLRALVAQGDDAARAQFRSQFLDDNAQALQRESLTAGNYTYERVGYLLADLTEPLALSVYLPEDQPGSLRALLHVFEQHGVNLSSIHSSRTPAGELHFRIGFESKSNRAAVAKAANEIDRSGIGRVLERSGQVD
ncbi:prephenate dehydrogenase, partial [Xanthomonas fragariae]|uniref:prephenate dehydrogenase n=1 Tax=Xanthomonas fragariae TaxID=48664 RepID=UPI000D54F28B